MSVCIGELRKDFVSITACRNLPDQEIDRILREARFDLGMAINRFYSKTASAFGNPPAKSRRPPQPAGPFSPASSSSSSASPFPSASASSPLPREAVSWCSVDPKSRRVIPYPDNVQDLLEAAYKSGDPRAAAVPYLCAHGQFTVCVASMQQHNGKGGYREVRRVTLPAARRSNPIQNPPPSPPASRSPPAGESDDLYRQCLNTVQFAIERANRIRSNPTAPPTWDVEDRNTAVRRVFEEMLDVFAADEQCQAKYGGSPGVWRQLSNCRNPPRYFANDRNSGIYQRKLLSMMGLRNLVADGFTVYSGLHAKRFASNGAVYSPGTGVHLMEAVTGNVVDLDTVVLRVDKATLSLVNADRARDGQPMFPSEEVFGGSWEAKAMAVNQAAPLLRCFNEMFSLSETEQAQRRTWVPESASFQVPAASSHTDRGNHPVWQYRKGHVNTFHANVPCVDDVVGSLLLAPWYAAKEQSLDDFFERGIDDTCFNAKWKSLDLYVSELE
eukprot:gene9392-14566_t